LEHRPVVFFEAEEWERSTIERLTPPFQSRFVTAPLSVATAGEARDSMAVSVFIHSHINGEVLAALTDVGLIATRSTGFDHIDLPACKERGVAVANVPHYGENTVAEHTFGLILTLSRNIHKAYLRTSSGDFTLEGLQGFDLKGKTLGVVGAGNIGLHVIQIARGFGMEVLAYDVQQGPMLAEVLGFRYVSLKELLSRSDIITLHMAALPSTHHLINRETLAFVKRGALLINTARGSIVDTEALIWALDEGLLAGAGLDVLEGEEYLKEERQLLGAPQAQDTLRTLVTNHILMHRPNVVITPHIAFNSHEALTRIVQTTIENITAFLEGHSNNLVH